jgi:uncharacterized protein (DUF1697 family)
VTSYVGLLRGINVGGKAKVEMPRLREAFARAGCSDVRTYINSGNVLFRDGRPPQEVRRAVEGTIADEFGWSIRVLLRDLASLRRLCDAIPATWTNDSAQKTDVLFLDDEVDRPDVLDSLVVDATVENVLHVPGALVWNVSRDNARRSNATKLVGTDLYRHLTGRNVNTVRKLRDLLEATGR